MFQTISHSLTSEAKSFVGMACRNGLSECFVGIKPDLLAPWKFMLATEFMLTLEYACNLSDRVCGDVEGVGRVPAMDSLDVACWVLRLLLVWSGGGSSMWLLYLCGGAMVAVSSGVAMGCRRGSLGSLGSHGGLPWGAEGAAWAAFCAFALR